MSERKPSECFFVPAKFKLGFFHMSRYDNVSNKSVFVNGGFPSCRFRGGDWTDVGLFKQLTGFRPTNQTDKAAEITKMVTGAVMEYDNVALGGFSLVSCGMELYRGSKYRYMCAVLHDPRGWDVEMEMADFWEMLMKSGVSVDENKVLRGVKLIYSWNPQGMFMLKDSESDEIRNAFDDRYFENIKSDMRKNSIDQSNLKNGTVYNLVTSIVKGVLTTERAVYVGKLRMHSPSEFNAIKYMQYISEPLRYKNGLRSHMASFYAYPWDNPNWKKGVDDFNNSIREYHVFIVLRDRYTQTYNFFNHDFLDNYLTEEHDYALSVDSLMLFDSVKGKVVGVSDDQTIAPSSDELRDNHHRHQLSSIKAPPKGFGISEYREYTIDEVRIAVEGHEKYMRNVVDNAIGNFPLERPSKFLEWMQKNPTDLKDEVNP